MDPNFPSSLQRQSNYPPGFTNSKKMQIKPTTNPYFPSNQVFNKGDILEPNKNTQSTFMIEPIANPYKGSSEMIIEHLDLDNFKSAPCLINYTHNHKHCPFYHNAKDRKRAGKFFISELCERCDNCPQGDLCQKSHNRVEQLYRPEKYKTKFCSFYPNNLDKCDYGIYCSFAHSESDIVVDLIHNYEYDKDFFMFLFKTTWCPFNLIVHDRALCVYAHNYQDFRRKPNVCFYDPNPCPNWKTSEFICNYEDACPNHYNCDKSHGWKESEYHPLHYKTRPCPNLNKCSKNLDCPFFHSSQDQRIIGQQIHYKIFKYHPKNRIVTNIFKITNPINVPKINNEVLNNPERTSSMTNINYDIENKEFSNFYKNQANLYKFNSQNNINFEMKDEINKAFHSYSFPKIDMSQIDNPAYYNQMMAYNNQMKQNQFNQNQNNNNNNNNNMNFNNNQKIDNNNNYKLFNSPQIFQNQNLNNNIQSNSQPNFVTSTSKFTIPDQKSATHFTNYKNSPKKTSKPENSVIGQGSTSHTCNSHGSIEKKEEREKISLKKKNLLDPEADNSGNSLDMMSNEFLRKMVMTDNFEDNINMKDKQNGRKESSEDIKSDDRLENLLKEICEDDNK